MFVKSELLNIADEILDNVEKTENGCWEWQGAKTAAGYGTIKRNGTSHYTHRIILKSHGEGFSENKDFACHHCDNPSCVKPEHLFAGSHKDNMKDAADKGRMTGPGLQGEEHGESKLTEKEVIEIREKYSTTNYTQKELANKYDVERPEIGHIIRGDKWQNVGGPILSPEERRSIYMKNRPEELPEKQGEKHHDAKLTKEDVIEIRKKYHNKNIYQKNLAKEYNLTRSNVGMIVRGDSWEHAPGPTG